MGNIEDEYITIRKRPTFDDLFYCFYCRRYSIVVDRNGLVCTDCGFVYDYGNMLIAGPTATLLDSLLPAIRKKTYKHIFYWNERMAQCCMREPEIPEEISQRLYHSYLSLIRAGAIEEGPPLPKSEVKKVIIHAGLPTSKYLEKYLSIGYRLTGIMPYESPPSLELIYKMSQDFLLLICIFFQNDRFGRHSMISYNLLIRELFKKHGAHEYVHLFPELKTRSKLNKAMEIYNAMWEQVIHTEIISTFGQLNIDCKIDNAKMDCREIAPRVTSRSHLKRKYTPIGTGYPVKNRRLS